MTVSVRAARVSDAAALAEVIVRGWQSAYAGIVPGDYLGSLSVESRRERLAERLAADPDAARRTFVGVLDGEVSGYAVGGEYRIQQDARAEDTAGWGELYAIYTAPGTYGKGVGTAVHDAVMGFLRRQGYAEAALWVLADNEPSQRWYRRRGWAADGETSQWHGAGTPLTEIRMRRSLVSAPEPRYGGTGGLQ